MSCRSSTGFRVLPPLLGFLLSVQLVGAGPRFEQIGKKKVLYVNGKPFVVLSIEDHNTVDFDGNPREEYFRIVSALNANTISVTFRWSAFEKPANRYDTAILRKIKTTAERHNLKVIILWFGSNVCGHENCAPGYVYDDSIAYIPYTRSDKSFATSIVGGRGARIYCYSFDKGHANTLLLREMKALEALISWIKQNDRSETFIMLQVENELFVHPELWRPWPPVYLPAIRLSAAENSYTWSDKFLIQGSGLEIETNTNIPAGSRLDFLVVDSLGNHQWRGQLASTGAQRVYVGGTFLYKTCQLVVRGENIHGDTLVVDFVEIQAMAERCHCVRCDEIYASRKFLSDRAFEQWVFMNYIKKLAHAIARVDSKFPLYLNLMIGAEAKMHLGNPYYRPGLYVDSVPDIDLLAPDIYQESSMPAIDSLGFGRNTVFVGETGRLGSQPGESSMSAFSLSFLILGHYHGIGVMQYGIDDRDVALLAPDGKWEEDAYLTRNSYAAIRQLPTAIFAQKDRRQIFGFRNVVKESARIGDVVFEARPSDGSKRARGIVARLGKSLIVCGISFEATITKPNLDLKNMRVERGYWRGNSYVVLGPPKEGSFDVDKNIIRIRMDKDDFSQPGLFDPMDKQYCVIIRPF